MNKFIRRSRRRFGRAGMASAAALFMSTFVLASVGAAAQEPPPRTITVSGTGTVEAPPDRARVRLGVETEAETAAEAQSETNRVADAILEAVRALGIADQAVQTSTLSLHPVYGEPPEGRRGQVTLRGYRATYTVSIEVDDVDRVGPVVDASLGAGATRLEGVEFDLRDAAEARAEALARAVEDARSRATAIAGALGVRLGSVLETREEGAAVAPPVPFAARTEAMAQDVATPIAPGRVRVTASVVLRYGIEPTPGG